MRLSLSFSLFFWVVNVISLRNVAEPGIHLSDFHDLTVNFIIDLSRVLCFLGMSALSIVDGCV